MLFSQLAKVTRAGIGFSVNKIRLRALSTVTNTINFNTVNVNEMSTSSSKSQEGCRLVCLQRSHDDIHLPDGVTVSIGRSPATRIIDAKCSRNQVAITSKWSDRKVRIQQLGANPSAVDGKDIGAKNEVEVGEDATIFILAGQYPHKVVFSGEDHKRSTDKSSKENKSASSNNHTSSGDVKHEKEDDKKVAKKRSSSSENGISDTKRKKHDKDNSSRSDNDKKDSSSAKKRHRDRSESSDKDVKMKKQKHVDDEGDEDEHMKLMASKLAAMKKSVNATELTPKRPEQESSKTPTHNATKKSSSSSLPSSSSSTPSAARENSWAQHEHLYVYTSKGVESRPKIAGFDVDGTIILTKSGKTFPVDHHDWRIAFPDIFGKLKQLHRDGFKLVFFTNQLGVARGKIKIEDLKTKLENIVAKLQVPIQVFVATHEGKYRKPVDGMWRKLKNQYNDGISINNSSSVFIGDAAGRPADWEPKKKKDFSLSDRLFALNIDVDFHTPEEFFLQRKKAPFTMPKFDPRKLSSSTPILPSGCKLTLDEKEVIVMVGLPASGKSHFVKHNLKTKGYVVVNRDTLGSWQKCVKVTKESLVNSSVVVDNTNLTPEERKRYLDCAKEASVPCRCFLMTTIFEHCRHNEKYREMTDSSHAKINEMIFNQARSKYKVPTMSEGFSELVKVNFVPKFSSSSSAAEYKKFILEK